MLRAKGYERVDFWQLKAWSGQLKKDNQRPKNPQRSTDSPRKSQCTISPTYWTYHALWTRPRYRSRRITAKNAKNGHCFFRFYLCRSQAYIWSYTTALQSTPELLACMTRCWAEASLGGCRIKIYKFARWIKRWVFWEHCLHGNILNRMGRVSGLA